jgi:hypothetical protein
MASHPVNVVSSANETGECEGLISRGVLSRPHAVPETLQRDKETRTYRTHDGRLPVKLRKHNKSAMLSFCYCIFLSS